MRERRNSNRYKIKKDSFIVHFRNTGNIENISLGGVLCSCINSEFDPKSFTKIDIRCKKNCFYLSNLGIQILKTKITEEKSSPHLFIRRCHLKFDNLTDIDIVRLSDFISAYAIF